MSVTTRTMEFVLYRLTDLHETVCTLFYLCSQFHYLEKKLRLLISVISENDTLITYSCHFMSVKHSDGDYRAKNSRILLMRRR